MATAPRFLSKRNGVWTYRRDIPARHQAVLGLKVWKVSTGEAVLAKAEIKARRWASEHDQMLDDLDSKGATAARALTVQREEAVRRTIRDSNSASAKLFAIRPAKSDADRLLVDSARQAAGKPERFRAAWLSGKAKAQARVALEKAPASIRQKVEEKGGFEAAVGSLEDADRSVILMQHALDMLEDSQPAHDDTTAEDARRHEDSVAGLEKRLLTAEGEAVALGEVLAPLGVVRNTIGRNPKKASGPTITEVFELWIAWKQQTPDTVRKWRVYVRRLVEMFGDLPVQSVTKTHIRDYVARIGKLPDTRSCRAAGRSSTVQNILDWHAKNPEVPLVTATTVAKHLDGLKAMLRWAVRNDYATVNAAQDIDAPPDKRTDDQKVRMFLPDELQLISRTAAKNWGAKDDKFMMLQVAIWTGARLEEVAQLAKENLKQEGGIWFIQIDNKDGRKTKNKFSNRRIPLHPKLIAAGFLDHAARSQGPRIFSTLSNKSTGRYGHSMSNAFHRLCDSAGFGEHGLRFHSIRHSFTGACRKAEVPVDIRYGLEGHQGINKIGEAYAPGDAGGYSIEILHKWISKIDPLASAPQGKPN